MEKTRKLVGFENAEISTREDLLKMLTELTMKMRNKVFYGRFTKPEIERLRIRYDHLFCEVIRTYNAILRDTEIEELKRRVDELERRLGYEKH
jgi:hypothetical protein